MQYSDNRIRPMLLSLACALALAGAAPGGAAPDPHRTLLRCAPPTRPEGAGPVFLAATFDPTSTPAAAWPDRLLKLQRGEFNAVHVVLPWSFGQPGSLQAEDLRLLLRRAERAGLKVILGPPLDGSAGDVRRWFASVEPVLTDRSGAVLWLQAGPKAAPALAELARALKPAVPVVVGSPVPVAGTPEKAPSLDSEAPPRPYRDAGVAMALRAAAAAGAPALLWESPFAGIAPPLAAETGDGVSPLLAAAAVGGPSVSYYEVRTFAQVARTLGSVLADGKPMGGARSESDKVKVTQRNTADRGYLFVQIEGEQRGFHLTFTDPVTKQKVTMPQQEGLRLRTFGSDARLLPLNLPLPGTKARVRYCTAEIFGTYLVGDTTLIFVADDAGAPDEIALSLDTDEEPPVLGTPAEPIWDSKGHTLTLGFIPSIDDEIIHIGPKIKLVVVPSERAQRTWDVRGKDAQQRNVSIPLISGAYLATDAVQEKSRLVLQLSSQQGSSDVTAFLEKRPGALTLNGLAVPMRYSESTGVLSFPLRCPQLAMLQLKVPPIQVLRDARFLARGLSTQLECSRPDYADAAKWPLVKLERTRGAGWYRVPFQVPSPMHWSIPWQVTLQIKGSAAVYLNGVPLGTVSGTGEAANPVRLDVPEGLLHPEGEENLLALCTSGDAVIQKVGVMPFMDHAVQQQEVAIVAAPPAPAPAAP